MWQRVKISVYCVTAALLLAAVSPIQEALTKSKSREWLQQRMSYLPKSEALKPLLLGFHSTYATYLWFKTVNYFGTHYVTDKSFPWLVHMVDMVTRLNPYFEPAYEFAGVLLPRFGGAPDAARTILERGIQYVGDRSYKPYFYLTVLELEYYKNRKMAAHYAARGALVPSEHNWKLARMAATFYQQAGEEQTAEEYLRMLLDVTDSPGVRRVVEEKLRELEAMRAKDIIHHRVTKRAGLGGE